MSGLFSIFNIANRGMAVQQSAINVTSHNIANANTEGYSRQRAIIETTRPFGMPTLNNAVGPGQLGTGAQISAIERVRDSFLDYQVRTESSKDGEYTARQQFLSEVEGIFNEPGDTGISNLIGQFFDSWQSLSTDAQNSNSRTIVAQQSAALADALNHASKQLSDLQGNVNTTIEGDVFEINDILNQVDQLNQQIRGVKISGQMPNDLMDKRDLLVDQLSKKFGIDVKPGTFEGQDISSEGVQVIKSENNDQEKRLSYVNSVQRIYDSSNNLTGCYVSYTKLGDTTSGSSGVTVRIDNVSEDDVKALENGKTIWTDINGDLATTVDPVTSDKVANDNIGNIVYKASAGELKGYNSVQQDISDYSSQLDKIAKALAFSVNALHADNDPTNAYTNPFFVNSETTKYNIVGGKSTLDTANSNIADNEAGITAANISVNKELMDNVMKINTSYDSDGGTNEGSRALAIAQLRNKLISIQDIGSVINNRNDLIGVNTPNPDPNSDSRSSVKTDDNARTVEFLSSNSGMTIDNYFKDVIGKLGVQSAEANRVVKNQESLLASFTQSKESVSGVSIDEEMANLIQYQHAYQANAKVISTVDELLDVVINGLKK